MNSLRNSYLFSRKNLHAPEEKLKLHSDLPRLFSNKDKIMVQNNFEQWNIDVNLYLVLGVEKSIFIAFKRWLLDNLTTEENVINELNNKKINMPSFATFIASKGKKYYIKLFLSLLTMKRILEKHPKVATDLMSPM